MLFCVDMMDIFDYLFRFLGFTFFTIIIKELLVFLMNST